MATYRTPGFPIGCSHHATFQKQAPPEDEESFAARLRSDCQSMAASGFNTFSLNVSWSDVEPRAGEWSFGRVDAAFSAAELSGQRVILWLWPELTPAWFGRAYPTSLAQSASGYRSQMHSSADLHARHCVRNFLEASVRRYKVRESLLAYNVSVEAGMWWTQHADSQDYDDRLWDYSDAAVKGFRIWLESKYRSICALNVQHQSSNRDFDEVLPPRGRYFTQQAMLSNQVPWLDWRLYTMDAFTDFLRFKVETVRRLDPDRPIVDHTHLIDPAFSGQDIWHIADHVDVMGMSMFTSNVPGDFMTTNWNMDLHRSAGRGKPVWVMELRSGQTTWGITNWGEPVSAADVARFTWQTIANGAKCIQYWNWLPHVGGVEVGGHGLRARDGGPTDRSERVGEIARLLQHLPIADFKTAPAQIAMLDSPRARVVASGEGSDQALSSTQRAWYAALRAAGFAIDFISEDDLRSANLSRYRLLILPFAYILDPQLADGIQRFGSHGSVIAGPFTGAKDAHGFGQNRLPGFGLDTFFGAESVEIRPCFSAEDGRTSTLSSAYNIPMTGKPWLTVSNPILEGGELEIGSRVEGFRLLETLRPKEGAEVILIAEDGAPVAIRNRRTILFGSLAGSRDDFADDGFAKFLRDVARWAGVAPSVDVVDRGARALDARVLISERHELLVLMNGEPSDQVVSIRRDGEWKDGLEAQPVGLSEIQVSARDVRVLVRDL